MLNTKAFGIPTKAKLVQEVCFYDWGEKRVVPAGTILEVNAAGDTAYFNDDYFVIHPHQFQLFLN